MSKDRLVTREDRGIWRITWWLADDGDYGSSLGHGNDGKGEPPTDIDAWENWIANKSIRDLRIGKPGRDVGGFYWESPTEAESALRVVKDAIKRGRDSRPMPDWAKKALAAGWKAPKGWKP